jgi:hypothetical protein
MPVLSMFWRTSDVSLRSKAEDLGAKLAVIAQLELGLCTCKILVKGVCVRTEMLPSSKSGRHRPPGSSPKWPGRVWSRGPRSRIWRKFKLGILAEPDDFGSAYPNTPVAAPSQYLREKRDTARKFMRAFVEAIYIYKTQPDFSKKVIAKYMRVSDSEAVDDSYQFFSRLVPAKPYPPLDGIREALLELGEKDAKARKARPEDFADMSLVTELDESGFIDGLYKGKK